MTTTAFAFVQYFDTPSPTILPTQKSYKCRANLTKSSFTVNAPLSFSSGFLSNSRLLIAPATPVQRVVPLGGLSSLRASASDSSSEGKGLFGQSPQKLKVGFFFALWYFFNVIFNIINKKTLNMWSMPWTLSTVQLGVGAAYCSILWILGLRTRPNVSWKLIKAMLLPSLGHCLGHIGSCISFSAVAISFTHIVKSAEPAVGALFAALFFGETYSLPVYLSLIPIIGGVGIASATELTFNWFGFLTAMSSNFTFALRNVFSKITMKDFKNDPTLTSENTYGLISIISFLMELPLCLYFDGIPSLAATGAAKVAEKTVLQYLLASSLLYHLYNEVSYLALGNVSPVTFSVGNTIKRVIIIATAIIFFKSKVTPLNLFGMAIAILGTFLYSMAKDKFMEQKKNAKAA